MVKSLFARLFQPCSSLVSPGNPPYYIVRNSWGKEFGLDGYIQLAIGDDTCAVAGEIAAISIETSW